MGTSKRKQIDDEIESWMRFLQRNWSTVRSCAANAYSDEGRGGFVVDMSQPQDQSLFVDSSFSYLSREGARHDNDSDLLRLLSGRVEWYNPEREIAFLFQHSDDPSIFYQRVLSEYPDGSPRPTPAARHNRWCGFERTCPMCNHAFIGLADFALCSNCGHGFLASEAEYKLQNREPLEPIARYIPPLTPPNDFDDLYDRIRELAIRDGEEILTDTNRLVWYALELYGEVSNGGLNQYFWNSSGDHAPDLLRLLRNSNLEGTAVLLGTACSVFPNGKPSQDRSQRHDQMGKLNEEAQQILEELTSEYYGLYPEYAHLTNDLWQFWQTAPQDSDA